MEPVQSNYEANLANATPLEKYLLSFAPDASLNPRYSYTTLAIGSGTPKNAITIDKNQRRVTFFIEAQQKIVDYESAGIHLAAVPLDGHDYNKDKFETFDIAKIMDPSNENYVRSLVQESVQILKRRQPSN